MLRSYLNLIRWKNLFMILYIFITFKYFFFQALNIPSFLDDLHYILFALSVILISAAGYVINDINDTEIDQVNKPEKVIIGKKISPDKAYNLYIILNLGGIAIGLYLSNNIGHFNFGFIYVLASLLLYQYAISLKKKFILNNIIISFLAGLSVFIIALYDLIPVINTDNRDIILQAFKVISTYSAFAFYVTMLREITKDIEDLKGDKKFGVSSLAIEIGRNTTKRLLSVLTAIPVVLIFYYSITYLSGQTLSLIYIFAFVLLPLIYFLIKILSAEKETDLAFLTRVLKFVMFTGISSIIVFTLIFKLNYAF